MPIGRLIRKIARQEIAPISQPPSSGPSAVGDAAEARPGADRPGPVAGPEAGLDDRQAAGGQQRAADPLQQPRADQQLDARRDRAEQRGDGEEADAEDEDAPPPVAVAERAAEQDQRGEGQQVAVEDPLQGAGAGVEVAADVRQRDVDHGAVEERHPRAERRRPRAASARRRSRRRFHRRHCGRPLAPSAIHASPSATARQRSIASEPSSTWSGLSSVIVSAAEPGAARSARRARSAFSKASPSLRPQFSESGASVKSTTSTSKCTSRRRSARQVASAGPPLPRDRRRPPPPARPRSPRRGSARARNWSPLRSRAEQHDLLGLEQRRRPRRRTSCAAPLDPEHVRHPHPIERPSVTLSGTLRSAWVSK